MNTITPPPSCSISTCMVIRGTWKCFPLNGTLKQDNDVLKATTISLSRMAYQRLPYVKL